MNELMSQSSSASNAARKFPQEKKNENKKRETNKTVETQILIDPVRFSAGK